MAFSSAVAGLISQMYDWSVVWVVASGFLAFTVGLLAFIRPVIFEQPKRAWLSLGLLLGRLGNPLILGIIFYLLITPLALVTRLFGRDELALKKRGVNSYWKHREPTRPSPNSFLKQY